MEPNPVQPFPGGDSGQSAQVPADDPQRPKLTRRRLRGCGRWARICVTRLEGCIRLDFRRFRRAGRHRTCQSGPDRASVGSLDYGATCRARPVRYCGAAGFEESGAGVNQSFFDLLSEVFENEANFGNSIALRIGRIMNSPTQSQNGIALWTAGRK